MSVLDKLAPKHGSSMQMYIEEPGEAGRQPQDLPAEKSLGQKVAEELLAALRGAYCAPCRMLGHGQQKSHVARKAMKKPRKDIKRARKEERQRQKRRR